MMKLGLRHATTMKRLLRWKRLDVLIHKGPTFPCDPPSTVDTRRGAREETCVEVTCLAESLGIVVIEDIVIEASLVRPKSL